MPLAEALRALVKAVTGEDAPVGMINSAELVMWLANHWPTAEPEPVSETDED